MDLSAMISGMVSIIIGIIILMNSLEIESVLWALFFIGLGLAVILYSKKADKIEGIRGKK
jgi:uncharacterized membrane protein